MPLKKNYTVKQFFETSDKISYNFNKIAPFSTKAKRSISECIIKMANKPDKTKEPERKFIKASGYYLHNFMMSNSPVKDSLLKFKLDEILKEKKALKIKMIEKLQKVNGQGSFLEPNQKYFKLLSKYKNLSSPLKIIDPNDKKMQIDSFGLRKLSTDVRGFNPPKGNRSFVIFRTVP